LDFLPELIRMPGVVAAQDVKDQQESFMAEIGKAAPVLRVG